MKYFRKYFIIARQIWNKTSDIMKKTQNVKHHPPNTTHFSSSQSHKLKKMINKYMKFMIYLLNVKHKIYLTIWTYETVTKNIKIKWQRWIRCDLTLIARKIKKVKNDFEKKWISIKVAGFKIDYKHYKNHGKFRISES